MRPAIPIGLPALFVLHTRTHKEEPMTCSSYRLSCAALMLFVLPAQSAWCQSSSFEQSSSFSYGWNGGMMPTSTWSIAHSGRNHLSLRNTPLLSAIKIATQGSQHEVLLSPAAQDKLTATQPTVTMELANQSTLTAVKRVLKGTDLEVREAGDRIEIRDSQEKDVDASAWATVESTLVRQALRQRYPLQMHHVPIQMATQMIEGMTGLRCRIPDSDPWSLSGPFVSVNGSGRPLSEVLEDLAEQLNCRVSVTEWGVELIKAERQ